MIDEKKAIGQFKMALNGTLSMFDMHGMNIHFPQVSDDIVKLALQLHRRLNGEDIPISIERVI